ncbi:callose synthase 9 [Dorcoceras hygrometricum]|uniref:Callose synthase 9 n=1 Tax=Dorcoceras hygrometricum TaxID=472368 RepID=A0A2Z7CS49_9LAMI|nr:callose synthase 9 [Dorcoceras hygrometricum]
MADRTTKKAKGFAAQICVLLKGDPAVTLGEAKTFPPLKIIYSKTVNTYIATNKTIDARGESDEPDVAKVSIVKKKFVSKNKSASIADKDADDVHVEVVSENAVSKKRPAAVSEATVVKKKRITSRKAVSKDKDLALISVAQDAVPIQVVEPISVVPAERPHAQKRKAPKRKLRMTAGSDDEIVEKESAVETVVAKQKGTTSVDVVDTIIEQVIAETAQLERDVVDPDVAKGIAMETDLAEPVVARSDDITVEISERSTAVTDEESMSIEDLLQQIPGDAMLPSVLAAEPTKIKFGIGIQIPGVHEVEQYKANLPQIAATDKENSCGRYYSSIRKLPALGSLEAIAAKEENVLTWVETDSVQTALQRRGRDDKKGEVGSSHGRGQPPSEDKSKPGSGDGGSGVSRNEPSRKRGSSGSKQRDWRYWING